MICGRCREVLVATDGALRGFAHDHGTSDHDADPVEPCPVCGGDGHLTIVNHGLPCRVRGCGPEAGCVVVVTACLACQKRELGDDLAWSASDRISLVERMWDWLSGLAVPGWSLVLPYGGRGPKKFWPPFESHPSSYQHTFDGAAE